MPDTQALVLAAHGSHHDLRSAAPVHAHANRIRERGGFDAVRAAFWKEQPSLAEVLATVEGSTTYVVPLMTSEGYFTDRVFPRELGLEDGRADGDDVRYTPPVGTHERIVDVVLDRVDSVLDDAVNESEVGLALVGHGTERHDESATATVAQADRLRALDRFAAVEPLFLDQAPTVGDLGRVFDVDGVVVVPFFVADGHHVRRDIPDALGLPTRDEPFGGPTPVDGKRVWYTGAVGTAPGLTTVILERAAEAGAGLPGDSGSGPASFSEAARAFLRWLEGGDEISNVVANSGRIRSWGELAITVTPEDDTRRYAVRHRDDRDVPAAELDHLAAPTAVRKRTGTDDSGNHRPLRTAKTLPRGWLARGFDREEAIRTVRAVYPASIDHWYREREGSFEPTDFSAVIDRQAGRYRELDELDSDTLAATIDACCGDCVRRPEWTDDGTGEPAPAHGDFPCPEPCSFLLEAGRSFADTDQSKRPTGDAVDPSVPAAAFNREGNRYRVRFRRAEATERGRKHPHLIP